ncbi:MAG: right-handed parallel beta-helix repeat-containing protein [Acidobacteria bacterium]|nr:MAG: right-handed parallel beta-helix repeat-containing protein [Acidobacteriota bacterium]REK09778.1 MAG: right-handed parallel beta-helix repeat-containing protein [Acidobacteriota bacterium]
MGPVPRNGSSRSIRWSFWSTAALVLAASSAASAAPVTWADPTGVCAGNNPCFTTIGDAVANAGPAPAQVFVFPGPFAESVDLNTMGSALVGGMPGDLTVTSVDVGGQPAPGALIAPASGPAITATSFPGSLSLDGLEVRSVDDNGILLASGIQPVLLVNVDANTCPTGNGVVVANSAGLVRVESSVARLNFNAGFALASQAGTVEVVDSLSERNDGSGFSLTGVSLSATGSQALNNGGDGFLVNTPTAGGALMLDDVTAQGNGGDGVFVLNVFLPQQFATAVVSQSVFSGNVDDGGTLAATDLTVSQLTASSNGSSGLVAAADSLDLSQVTAEDNGSEGILAVASVSAAAFDITARDNGSSGFDLLTAGAPGAVATVDGVIVTGNMEDGFTLGLVDPQLPAFSGASIVGVTANSNGAGGVAAIVEDSLTIDQVSASGNVSVGVGVFAGGTAELSFITATGHGSFGIGGLAESLTIRDSSADSNVVGFGLFGSTDIVLERTSATGNGPSGGNPPDGAGYALVGVAGLEVSEAVSETNEIGWFFADSQNPRDPEVLAGLGALGQGFAGLLDATAAPPPRGGPTQRITMQQTRTESNVLGSVDMTLLSPNQVRVHCSDFVANGPSGFELQTAATVDASLNYWGAASGPTHPGNPSGTGDVVLDAANGGVGVVSWSPFLVAPATADDCPVLVPVTEIPTLGSTAAAVLALLMALAATAVLRRR